SPEPRQGSTAWASVVAIRGTYRADTAHDTGGSLIEDAQLIDHPTLAENGILAEGVTRSFGDVWAVRGMDLVVPYGRVTALVGPNGAGKTTLMLMLATLLRPTAGRLRIAGVDPTADPVAVRRLTGWMPDTLGMYDQLKVHEYLEFFAEAHQLSK